MCGSALPNALRGNTELSEIGFIEPKSYLTFGTREIISEIHEASSEAKYGLPAVSLLP